MFTTNAIVELIKKAVEERNNNVFDELIRHGDKVSADAKMRERRWSIVTSSFDKILLMGPPVGEGANRVFLIEVKEAM